MSEAMVNEPFCRHLRYLRVSLGISQTELAGRVHLSCSQINRLEQGKRRPCVQVVREKFVPALQLAADDPQACFLVRAAIKAQMGD